MSDTPKIITFVDHIGRTLLAEFVEDVDNGTSFIAKNPAIIHVQPTQQGQLNVQTIPLFFREFVGDRSKAEGTKWKFHYATVVLGIDVDNDPRLVDQYTKLFAPAAPAVEENVVKLFDE
jgi:hypothetical protein